MSIGETLPGNFGESAMLKPEIPKSLSTSFLRAQAERCLRLSQMCMDMGTARDLRLMADEYFAQAKQLEEAERDKRRGGVADNSNQMWNEASQERGQRSARG